MPSLCWVPVVVSQRQAAAAGGIREPRSLASLPAETEEDRAPHGAAAPRIGVAVLRRRESSGMSEKKNRFVVRHRDGWAVRGPKSRRSSGVLGAQQVAIRRAREIVRRRRGGEVPIQNRQGQWRDADTIAPGNDAFPPRHGN